MAINLDTISIPELEEMLYKLAHKCYAIDKEFIQADEQFQILDDNRKSYLASIVDKQSGKTTAEKERAALQSAEYLGWLEGYQAARRASRQARVEKDNIIRLYETARSILSSRNTQKRAGI